MHLRIFLVACLSAIAPFAAGAGRVASAHGILLGVDTHVTTGQPHEHQAQLDVARKIGFNAVRDGFLWQSAEPAKGVYRIPAIWDQYVNEARQLGLQPLVILCYGNKYYDGGDKPRSRRAIRAFVRYATFVVKHFSGRVHYFEIWNEWDTHAGGFPSGDARDYAKLFDAVYPAVKEIDPKAVFLASASAGGDNGWYRRIARLGIARLADGVSVHPYVYPRQPNTGSLRVSNEAERSVQQVINIETTMSRLSGGKEIPLYITEIGWPTNVGRLGLPEEASASLAQRALLMFSALPYVHGIWWYDLRDDCSDAARYLCRFGAVHRNYAFKPAAYAIASVAPLIEHHDLTFSQQSNLGAGLIVLKLEVPTPTIIAWDAGNPAQHGHAIGLPAYAVSCAPSLRVVHTAPRAPASDLTISSEPEIFTDGGGHCTRKALPVPRLTVGQ